MELQIQGFGTDNIELYQKSLDIRQEVFVKELGFDKHIEFDAFDDKSLHFILVYNGIYAGSLRCKETNEELIIDRFCIIKEYRNRGFGTLFLKYVILELLPSAKSIKCFSTYLTQEFYQQRRFTELISEEEFGSKKVIILKYSNG